MIEYLRGKLKCRLPTGAIVDVSGVGYGVDLPLNVLCDLPAPDSDVEFWIHTRVREDSFRLYGFKHRDDRRAFEVLLQVSGIGPKVAMAILSTMSVGRLRLIVEAGQIESFEAVPGIGKRTAEKILVELKSRLDRLPSSRHEPTYGESARDASEPVSDEDLHLKELNEDLNLALANLGYKEKEIQGTLKKVGMHMEATDFSAKLKLSLHYLRGGGPSKQRHDQEREFNSAPLDTLF
jgi:Holliday junction DNA helicase RuvA